MGESKSDDPLEVGTKGVKVPLGFILRTLAPNFVARAETVQALCCSASEKIGRGEVLSSEERAVFDHVMGPVFDKAARRSHVEARAVTILTSEPKALPPSTSNQAKDEPATPSAAFKDRWDEGAGISSDDDVAEMWARILAGEITTPGSFSFKTLSVLKDMDTATAEAFIRLIRYELVGGTMIPQWEVFQKVYAQQGLEYRTMLALADVGLLNFHPSVMNTDPQMTLLFPCGLGALVQLSGRAVRVPVHLLTRAGAELARVADPRPQAECLEALAGWFRKMYVSVNVSVRGAGKNFGPFRSWTPDLLIVDDQGAVTFAPTHPTVEEET